MRQVPVAADDKPTRITQKTKCMRGSESLHQVHAVCPASSTISGRPCSWSTADATTLQHFAVLWEAFGGAIGLDLTVNGSDPAFVAQPSPTWHSRSGAFPGPYRRRNSIIRSG